MIKRSKEGGGDPARKGKYYGYKRSSPDAEGDRRLADRQHHAHFRADRRILRPASAGGEGHRRRRRGQGDQGPGPGFRRPTYPRGHRGSGKGSIEAPQDGAAQAQDAGGEA